MRDSDKHIIDSLVDIANKPWDRGSGHAMFTVMAASAIITRLIEESDMNWKPIETAPSKQRVLTLRKGGHIAIADYDRYGSVTGWHVGPGEFIFGVTHWMHIPRALYDN